MIDINPGIVRKATVSVPGSKSYTHRMLIAAALSDGRCVVDNPLISEDTLITQKCLMRMGVTISKENDCLIVKGCSGRMENPGAPIDLGNSGTSMRLLSAVAALGRGPVTLTGTRRMRDRPIQNLIRVSMI